MIRTLQNIKQPKKVMLSLIFVGAFAVPLSVQAYSQDTPAPKPGVVTDQEQVPDNTPVVTLVQQTEEEEPKPEEPTTPEQPPVEEVEGSSVALALAIAEAEHPESTVVAFKAKTYKGVSVYKFYFRDGYKVVLKADDGTVLKSGFYKKDKKHNHHKKWHNKHSNHDRGDNRRGHGHHGERG